MRNLISIREHVQTLPVDGGTAELIATADATYDPQASQLRVRLEAFLRAADFGGGERMVRDWVREPETVEESVALEDAIPAAREIFAYWVERVRKQADSRLTPVTGGTYDHEVSRRVCD